MDQDNRAFIGNFARNIREHPSWPVLISEGDSWLSYPLHSNVVDWLDAVPRRSIALLRLERSGEELLTIFGGRQRKKLRGLLERFPVDALVFSGGGNDIVGPELLALLRRKESGMSWRDCIDDDRAGRRIQQLELAYRDLVDLRDDARPNCIVYVHGYDYAIPSGKGIRIFGRQFGPWMRPHLEAKGITDPEDQRRVIRWLIDRFNEMLIAVQDSSAAFVHVDTRGTLADDEWANELHPTAQGFRRIADVYKGLLRTRFPATDWSSP